MPQNVNHYNLHSTRGYPLDESATGIDDTGVRMPDDLLVDCRLRFPPYAGQYAFIGGITVTPNIVTITFRAATSLTTGSTAAPLGAVTLPQPVDRHRIYNIEPQIPGVAGYVVWGDVTETYIGRFSSPSQSLLTPDTAHPTIQFPIPEARKQHNLTALTGLIQLIGGSDVEIVKEVLEINGDSHDAIVMRLVQGNFAENVLSRYIGPCGTRPESRNCLKAAIEAINEVAPDCDGNIEIDFIDMTAAPYDSCGSEGAGVVLDQTAGLDEVCAAQGAERFLGTDQCESASSLSSESLGSESASSAGIAPPGPAVSSESCAPLPYVETFDDGVADDFSIKKGTFGFTAIDTPGESEGGLPDMSYTATAGSQRNVSVLDNCIISETTDKRITTHLALTNTETEQNGGLALNYHLVGLNYEYYVAEINKNLNRVRLLRFNGAVFIEEHSVTPPSVFVLGHWYKIEVEVTLPGTPTIEVTVRGISNPSWGSVNFSILANNYSPDDGLFGVATNRAYTHFGFLQLEQI